MAVETGAFGPNSDQLEALLDQLRVLPARQWPKLDAAYKSLDIDKFEDTLVAALDKSGLREQWFALRRAASELARAAARAYATEVGEERRTLEYVKSVNAWDGQHEQMFEESLPPVEERGFIDAACGACGVVFMRPLVAQAEFGRLWDPFESVL